MESNSHGPRHDHQAPQWVDPRSALSSDAMVNADGRREETFPDSEAMDLALEVAQTSAEVYELVAAVAGALTEPVNGNAVTEGQFPQAATSLPARGLESIEETERHLRYLESKTVTIRPEILELFPNDCWAALATFREVIGLLDGVLELDGSAKPSATAAEILWQIMEHLDNCSKEVSGLAAAGLAPSSQCLAETAFNLRDRASKLAG